MNAETRPLRILRCPDCHGSLEDLDAGVRCLACSRSYQPNTEGYLEFMPDRSLQKKESTNPRKADAQASAGATRMMQEYIEPYIFREPFETVLDVGCGIGNLISRLLQGGYDAYGIDLPTLSGFWSEGDNDRDRFYCCDATQLPFADDSIDVIISTGVIEHIGTGLGNNTLQGDYQIRRQRYADEILRVCRPGGRILVACPNKSFPIDPQHEVIDGYNQDNISTRIRSRIYDKTSLNIHKVWGEYHLLSYREIRQLFCVNGAARSVQALPLKDYFGLTMFQSGYLKPVRRLADVYINKMPRFLQETPFNPYVLVEIRK